MTDEPTRNPCEMPPLRDAFEAWVKSAPEFATEFAPFTAATVAKPRPVADAG